MYTIEKDITEILYNLRRIRRKKHLSQKDVAEKIYERHLFFTEQLVAVGVDQKTAEQDACRIEHAISEESFQKLKASVKK